jgi:hypothetical protein
MKEQSLYPRQSLRFGFLILLGLLLTFTSQWIHETGHWLILRGYGREPVWGFTRLIQIWGKTPPDPWNWQRTVSPDGEVGWLKLNALPQTGFETALFFIAGPATSLFGLLAGIGLMHWAAHPGWRHLGRGLALSLSLGMTLYYLRAPWRTGGDEAVFALAAGIPPWAVNLFLSLLFLAGLVLVLRSLPNWKSRIKWVGAFFLGSALAGVMLFFLDQWILQGTLAGKTIFQPILGFSLPVFIFNSALTWLAVASLLISQYPQKPSSLPHEKEEDQ